MQISNKAQKSTQSRRRFLKNTSSVTLLIGSVGILPQLMSCNDSEIVPETVNGQAINAWMNLTKSGQITIYNPATEMGQGSMTALPLIFAEEMDADWDKVNVEFSAQDADVYGRSFGPGKSQMTVGSTGVMTYFQLLRQAGAQARYVLLNSVADHWDVDISELTTQPSMVIHKSSNRKISYGEIVPFLKVPESIPTISDDKLKNPKDFRLIGKQIPRNDIPSKVNGTAQFSLDVKLPDMLYGMLERGKVHGAKPTLNNETEIKAMNGVVAIHKFEYAIGVVTEKVEQAFLAKKKLDIDWSDSEATGFNSADAFSNYEKVLAKGTQGKTTINKGDFSAAKKSASKTYSVDFKNDYIYHAQKEPLNSVVRMSENLTEAEVWIGSQDGVSAKKNIAKALDLDASKVKVYQQYLGGGFGRRTKSDYGVEAAILAKVVAPKPVKLIWTREDDLHYGMYRPLSLQRLEACTDADGTLTALSHSVVGDGDRLIADGADIGDYNIPIHKVEVHIVPQGIRVKHWRAVGHGANKYAIECMMDEIAAAQNTDPIQFRKQYLKPRALATLEKAASMANWGQALAKGRARGVAFLERSRTLSTGICEISIDRNTGKIRVHHFWSAHDAGIIVQPDSVKAQIEGGIIMGMSSVLMEQISIVNGEVQQNNFNDYPIIRMNDIPETIETALLDVSTPPTGVGESGTPLVACAIANAFLALTGKPLRHLPFTPKKVLEVLS